MYNFTRRILSYGPTFTNPFHSSVEAARGYGETTFDADAGPSVVAIEEDHQLDHEADAFVDVDAEEQTMPTPALKKRGRPSLSRSETPAKPPSAKTPRSAKKVATPKSAGRKRKAPEPEEQDEEEDEEVEEAEPEDESEAVEEPAKKRGRPAARAAAVVTSTRLSASKPARGRPKSATATVCIVSAMIATKDDPLTTDRQPKLQSPPRARAAVPRS